MLMGVFFFKIYCPFLFWVENPDFLPILYRCVFPGGLLWQILIAGPQKGIQWGYLVNFKIKVINLIRFPELEPLITVCKLQLIKPEPLCNMYVVYKQSQKLCAILDENIQACKSKRNYLKYSIQNMKADKWSEIVGILLNTK